RATALVFDAFEANELPPHPFPLKELSGDIRKPDLKDLKRVFELRHLARCVEQMCFKRDPGLGTATPLLDREFYKRDNIACFHTSIYRVLLAGAVLTRPYLEPMFLAPTQGPADLLFRWQRRGFFEGLLPEDIEYLERFPVYRLEATDDEWEPVFGDLARWLVDDVKKTASPLDPRFTGGRPLGHLAPDEKGCLQEVVFFLAAYEHMISKFFNNYIANPEDEDIDPDTLIPPPFPGDVRDVSTAMFGMFRPERVSTPAKVEDASRTCLVNFPPGHYPRDNSVFPKVSPWNTDVRCLLQSLQASSGRPNRRDDWPSPPPELRFVEFVMRKFFRVGFRDRVFEEENRWYMENYTNTFLDCPDLFGDHFFLYWDVASAILAPYQTPALSYRRNSDW
ncbi:hypothetical protein QBC39DRAFT_415664, partial [Podospora conica]